MTTRKSPIERAIEVCGSQSELARRIGRSQQIVSYWNAAKKIPPDMAPLVERATGIPRHELCPEVFGEGTAA